MTMTTQDPIDPRLAILMQWLKENDETAASEHEHANDHSTWIPDLIDGTDYD